MKFESWEGGCTRITSENKEDKELLENLYSRVPENQKGGAPNKWSLCRAGNGRVTIEVLPRNSYL